MEWQPIETAPRDKRIWLHGFSVLGQAAPGGPYKAWRTTVGEIDDYGRLAFDEFQPGCDCIRGGQMDEVTHWMPFVLPAPPAQAIEARSDETA